MDHLDLRADHWRDKHTRAAVAVEGQHLVAAGMIWTSRVHDDRYWVDIVVAPDHRRRGVGSAMFGHLCTLRHDDRALTARGFVGDPALQFADVLGARTVQVVPPSHIEVAHRVRLRPWPGVVHGTDVAMSYLAAANATTYQWTHANWAPVAPGFAQALSEDLLADLDRTATAVALCATGQPRAMALVYKDSPTIITAETVHPHDRDGERVVEGCLRAALDAVASQGITHVEFDGHISDPHFFPAWIKLDPTGRWFRLVEIPPR